VAKDRLPIFRQLQVSPLDRGNRGNFRGQFWVVVPPSSMPLPNAKTTMEFCNEDSKTVCYGGGFGEMCLMK